MIYNKRNTMKITGKIQGVPASHLSIERVDIMAREVVVHIDVLAGNMIDGIMLVKLYPEHVSLIVHPHTGKDIEIKW